MEERKAIGQVARINMGRKAGRPVCKIDGGKEGNWAGGKESR